MKHFNQIIKVLAAVLIGATCIGSLAYAQEINPNKLRPCPKPDYSKKDPYKRVAKWTNCWGRVKISPEEIIESEWKDGKPSGRFMGNYYGAKYIVDFKDGNRGQGSVTFPNGTTYVGEFKGDDIDGKGTLTYSNGDRYFGYFLNNRLNGQGTYIFANGDRYVGGFDDMPTGLGYFTFANGDIYEGESIVGRFLGHDAAGKRFQARWIAGSRSPIQLGVPASVYESLILVDRLITFDKLPLCPQDQSSTYNNCWGSHDFTESSQFKGDQYVGEFKDNKFHGYGIYSYANGHKYVGEFKEGNQHGQGTYTRPFEYVFFGEFKDNKIHGRGMLIFPDGRKREGIWENNEPVREAKVSLPALNNNIATNTDRNGIDRERQQLAEERRRLEEEKRQREQAKSSQRINLQVTNTQPTSDGSFFIEIKTNADTASLQIDGKEEGGKVDGNYIIKRVARAGSASSFRIVATDVYGNTETKTINVSRAIVESKTTYAALNPGQVKQQSFRDAVAIIIGIAEYKSLPKADFSNDDALAFYDYAIRALGVKPENIKLLVDGDADEAEILRTFRNWLPSKVKPTTDVYVFYSGHGLPTTDGQGLYLIPPRAAKDLIDDTAIPFSKINAALQSAKPKSVTMILDACYSGQARSGETLVASARPIRLKTENRLFPESFTVITASQNDQISSSNPDLQHGIFSYYLMKGMEGDADTNRDGKITLGEMQEYLVEKVGRQAGMMNRKQEPQFVGDPNRVLVGR